MAVEITFKGMTFVEVETQIIQAAERFQAPAAGALPGDVEALPAETGAGEGTAPAAAARRPGRPRRVVAPAPEAAAGEVQAPAAASQIDIEDLAGAPGGAAGPVEPEEAAEDPSGADVPGDAGREAGVPAAVGVLEAGADAGGGEAAATENAVEAAERPAAGDGADAPAEGPTTIEDLKALAKKVAADKSFETMKGVFDKHGVAKPGACPEDLIPAVMADLRAAL